MDTELPWQEQDGRWALRDWSPLLVGDRVLAYVPAEALWVSGAVEHHLARYGVRLDDGALRGEWLPFEALPRVSRLAPATPSQGTLGGPETGVVP